MEMFGSGVQICMVLTQVLKRPIPLVPLQRPITSVVFVAVRGAATIRTSSGALNVSATALISGSSSSAFVFPQDRRRILFSGAAFSGPFAGSGLWRCGVSGYRRFRRRVACVSVRMNR